ncbi:cytochrome P450 [Trametes elegans]|nr:cytochrome P450 [Trametes elegans]
MAHPALVAALLCVPLFIVYRYTRRWAHARPPGPPGLPLIGNALDVPTPQEYPWMKYHQMCKQYKTDILRLNVLGTTIIVIDTLKPAVELLDKRSSMYSDRPRMIMLNELAGFGWNFGSMEYGEDWRECRKMTHHEFHAKSFEKYRPVLLKNTHDFLRRIASQRGVLTAIRCRMVGANIMKIVYDIKVLPEHDPFITLAEAGEECVGRSTTGGLYLVEVLPFLKLVPSWLPGAGFKRQAEIWRQAAEKQLHVAYDDFLHRMVAHQPMIGSSTSVLTRPGKAGGSAQDCMARSLLETYDPGDPVTDHRLRATTATMYLGGSETTAAALHTFFLAMALYPDVQAKARKQLDQVVGTCHLPTFADFGSLPYIDAIVKELLRWYPIVPLLIPHKSSTDDVYEGYLIEKGSYVMVNIWAILHDEKRYHDPFTFNPDRFLKGGALDPTVFDPEEVAFGFGRRICPGRYMAYDGMWITVASVLACFEIGTAMDESGREIKLREDFVSSFVCEPKPFKCNIRPRSDAHLALFTEH